METNKTTKGRDLKGSNVLATETQTKKQIVGMFKKNVPFYAIPERMDKRSKSELIKSYNEAVSLRLVNRPTETQKNVLGNSKTFKVLLTRYPEEFTVHAENKESALAIAKGRFIYSVWESEVKEVTE